MTDVDTRVNSLAETSSTSTNPADAPAGSETQRNVFKGKYKYDVNAPSRSINADGQTIEFFYDRDFPLSKHRRGVALRITGKSDAVLTTCDGVTELKSDVLTKLFGGGDQWKFDTTEEKESDGKFAHRLFKSSQDLQDLQAHLPGVIFRPVMGIPWLVEGESAGLVPRTLVESIEVVYWSMQNATGRQVEGNQVTYLQGQHSVELEVALGMWEDEQPTCYTEKTLDQGWPGRARNVSTLLQKGDDPIERQESWFGV